LPLDSIYGSSRGRPDISSRQVSARNGAEQRQCLGTGDASEAYQASKWNCDVKTCL